MDNVVVQCPECGKKLRVKQDLLGKKAKCPACSNRFVLEAPADAVPAEAGPEPVEFQFASPRPQPAARGSSARWVPDDEPEPSFPSVSEPAGGTSTAVKDDSDQAIETISQRTTGGTARLRELKRRNAKRRNIAIVLGAVTAFAILGAVYGVRRYLAQQAYLEAKKEAEARQPKPNKARDASKAAQRTNLEIARSFDPTRGEPIELTMLPAGTRFVIHVRPAEIWQEGSLGQEVLYCLGPLGKYLEEKVKEYGHFEPQKIEELLIAIIPGPRGTVPEVASVVKLVEPAKESDLILKFPGEILDDTASIRTYLDEQNELAYTRRPDRRTIAICPIENADEVAASVVEPNPTDPGIEVMMHETDRQRHFTLVFQPNEARIHREELADERLWPAWSLVLDWLGEEADTIVWSAHLGDRFYTDVKVKPRKVSGVDQVMTPERLNRQFRDRLDALPREMYRLVRFMSPEKLGHRRMIGRFPAMLQAYSMATLGGTAEDHVQLTTILDERAAPNLALAALLTWDESTRTDFSQEPATPSETEKLPELLADRLKKPILIDFRRTPLQDAFAYIGDETKVKFDIDGDALKLSGYTKNMPQNHKLGKVPATKALGAIVSQYEDMCLIVDEKQDLATVMTKPVAEKRGLKPFPLP